MSLTVIRRKRNHNTFTPCINRCRDKKFHGSNVGYRSATHSAVILDVEIPLCGGCAKSWPVMWEAALHPELELVAA